MDNTNNADFESDWESFSNSPNSVSGAGNSDFESEWADFSNESDDSDNGQRNYYNFGDEENNNTQSNNTYIDNSVNDYWSQQENYQNQQQSQDNAWGSQQQFQGNQQQQTQGNNQWNNQQQLQGNNQWNNQQQPQGNNQQQLQNNQWNNQQQSQGNNQWGNQQQFQMQGNQQQPSNLINNLRNTIPSQANFGYKGIGVIIIIALILVAGIVIAITRVHPKSDSTTNTQQVQQGQSPDSQAVQQPANNSAFALIEIPSSTKLNFGDTIEAQGTVTGFDRYLLGNQVLYCIFLNVNGIDAKFFCTYNTYGSITKGSVVTVKYQMIDSNYISVIDVIGGS